MATKKKSEVNQNVVTETKEEVKEEVKEIEETKEETQIQEETKTETQNVSDSSIEIKSEYKAKISETGREIIGTITATNRLEIYKGNMLCPEWDSFVNAGTVLDVAVVVNNFIILGDGRLVKREDEHTRYKFNA